MQPFLRLRSVLYIIDLNNRYIDSFEVFLQRFRDLRLVFFLFDSRNKRIYTYEKNQRAYSAEKIEKNIR